MRFIARVGTLRQCTRTAWCLGLAALLAACGSTPRAPVQDRSTGMFSTTPRVDPATLPGHEFAGRPGYYTVQQGDTIRSVARANGLDWRDITRWNSQWVPNPDQIEVGQVLRVVPPLGMAAHGPAPVVRHRAPAATTAAAPAVRHARAHEAPAVTPAPAAPAVQGHASGASAAGISLAWPTRGGAILSSFDGDRNKGISIGGREGDPIMAAADGKVMYAGSGLRGYGNLIILKHNNTFLTVYAHNSKLLVRENQTVRKGQTIAEMGRSDSDRVKLHFELRRNGTSVNPLTYLPSRP